MGGPIQDVGVPQRVVAPFTPAERTLCGAAAQGVPPCPPAEPPICSGGGYIPILMARQWVCDVSPHEWRFHPGLLTTSRTSQL